MANKYILNPDGTVSKYGEDNNIEETVELDINPDKAPALDNGIIENNTAHNTVKSNDNDEWLDLETERANIVTNISNSKNFGFIGDNGEVKDNTGTIASFKPFNSYSDVRGNLRNPSIDANKPKVFADEFEILGGARFDGDTVDSNSTGLAGAMFSYFIESIVRAITVEAVVLVNRLLTLANGDRSRTKERFILKIGRYDYTEYDLFTRYVYNVLNYPHDSSHITERLVAYFVGFSEWLCPDSLIDLTEVIKDTTSSQNDLDFISDLVTYGDHKGIFPVLSELVVVAYTAIKVALVGLSNQTVQNRANLLFRKFYQEAYWVENNLYSAKEKEDSIPDLFTDLNYYYFKFYIERVQIGLKIINKYIYDDAYLKMRLKSSPQNRVSGQTSNKHINYGISSYLQIDNYLSGDALAKEKERIAKKNIEIDIANKGIEALNKASEIAGYPLNKPLIPKEELPYVQVYDWQYRHSDGDRDSEITKNKKPGQSTRIRALPQLFAMHPSLYRALAANGKPKIELGRDLMQNFFDLGDVKKRIPQSAVNDIENVLEAEYMPFYFHDVRTNEVLSFHAFIESITDSFNPEYNSSSGFGRIDDVRTYVKTTRNINLSFTLAATSESDHDVMWYQINKIVAMVYPQWSDGFNVLKRNANNEPETDANGNPIIDFKYPFTQVPTASPLIRLRVGDVIKSNYSRTNLSRLHGVGERSDDINLSMSAEFHGEEKVYELLPGLYRTDAPGVAGLQINGQGIDSRASKSINIDHPVPIINIKPEDDDKFYLVSIPNPYHAELKPEDLLKMPPDLPVKKTIDVIVDSSKILVKYNYSNKAEQALKDTTKNLMDPTKKVGEIEKSNNPITKSYESGMSRGLAGFITQLDVNYNEVNWETSRIGSKAPMLVKITINFAPIHDIPPGLDHNGMLRAPVYNVGRINNEFFGDPLDKDYTGHGRDKAMAKYMMLDHLNKKKYEEPKS